MIDVPGDTLGALAGATRAVEVPVVNDQLCVEPSALPAESFTPDDPPVIVTVSFVDDTSVVAGEIVTMREVAL
jgi:hypothetical protein